MADVSTASTSKVIKISNLKWTHDQERELIELVKNEKHLWYVKNTLYSNRTYKRVTYQGITESLISKFPENIIFLLSVVTLPYTLLIRNLL